MGNLNFREKTFRMRELWAQQNVEKRNLRLEEIWTIRIQRKSS
jgi:hypothetical protein